MSGGIRTLFLQSEPIYATMCCLRLKIWRFRFKIIDWNKVKIRYDEDEGKSRPIDKRRVNSYAR